MVFSSNSGLNLFNNGIPKIKHDLNQEEPEIQLHIKLHQQMSEASAQVNGKQLQNNKPNELPWAYQGILDASKHCY